MKRVIIICLLFYLNVTFGIAQTTGKIAGRVVDKNTSQPLAGINIYLEGTNLGAASSEDGSFFIINIPPGEYTVHFSFIGYKEVVVKNVRVQAGRTTSQNIFMEQQVIEGESIEITAEREAIEFDRTNTSAHVNAHTIGLLPVQELDDIIQLQSGVVRGSGGELHFRGGREREVSYVIDGIPVNNSFAQNGGSNVEIENEFVSELQVITGTFNAEYGSAQSGIISVVTKNPEQHFNGRLQAFGGVYYSGKTDRYIGIERLTPLAERDVQMTFSGPIFGNKLGFFFYGRYYHNSGHLRGERRYMPQDGWKIDAYRRWFVQRHSSDFEQFGRIPLPDSLKTGDNGIIPMAANEKFSASFKLLYRPFSSFRITYALFGDVKDIQYYNDAWRYAPDGRNTNHEWAQNHLLSFQHNPTKNIFYNLRLSYQDNNEKTYLYEDVKIARYPGDSGYLPMGAYDPQTGFVQGSNEWGRNSLRRQLVLINGDFNWQIDKYNFLKFGFEAKQHRFHYKNQPLIATTEWKNSQYINSINGKELDFDEYWTQMVEYWKNWENQYHTEKLRLANHFDGSYRDYERSPREAAVYLQDKFEYNDIVVNAGLRYEYFDPNAKTLINKRQLSGKIGSEENLRPTEVKHFLLPRLGISFPISSAGAFHIAYGHFIQNPSFSLLFSRPVDENMTSLLLEGSRIGDPDLKPERTVSYEIGLQQKLSSSYVGNITLFYKNIYDQLGVELVKTTDAVGYTRYINRDYGNVKGVTIAIKNYASVFFDFSLDYTYQVAKGSASDPNSLQLIEVSSRLSGEPIPFPERQILPLDWDQRHTINLVLNFHQPKNWAASLLMRYGSGLPYTPTSVEQMQLPDREFKNSARKPVRYSVDLKAQKIIRIFDLPFTVFLKIYNLFDHLNENYVYSTTGTAKKNARLPHDEQIQREMIRQGGQFTMQEWDNKPHWFSPPRRIQLGIEVNLGFK